MVLRLPGGKVPVFVVEGYAAVGEVAEVQLKRCFSGRAAIVARLRSGETLETPCIDERGATRALNTIREYMRLSKLLVKGSE